MVYLLLLRPWYSSKAGQRITEDRRKDEVDAEGKHFSSVFLTHWSAHLWLLCEVSKNNVEFTCSPMDWGGIRSCLCEDFSFSLQITGTRRGYHRSCLVLNVSPYQDRD